MAATDAAAPCCTSANVVFFWVIPRREQATPTCRDKRQRASKTHAHTRPRRHDENITSRTTERCHPRWQPRLRTSATQGSVAATWTVNMYVPPKTAHQGALPAVQSPAAAPDRPSRRHAPLPARRTGTGTVHARLPAGRCWKLVQQPSWAQTASACRSRHQRLTR